MFQALMPAIKALTTTGPGLAALGSGMGSVGEIASLFIKNPKTRADVLSASQMLKGVTQVGANIVEGLKGLKINPPGGEEAAKTAEGIQNALDSGLFNKFPKIPITDTGGLIGKGGVLGKGGVFGKTNLGGLINDKNLGGLAVQAATGGLEGAVGQAAKGNFGGVLGKGGNSVFNVISNPSQHLTPGVTQEWLKNIFADDQGYIYDLMIDKKK